MIKSILVPVTGGLFDAAASELALVAAHTFNGHLKFLCVRPDPVELLTATLLADYGGSAVVLEQLAESVATEGDERVRQAKAAFEAWCERERITISDVPGKAASKVSAEWTEMMGSETGCLTSAARRCDLTVLNCPGSAEGTPRGMVEALLLTSGRPMLLCPRERQERLATKVAIAWKNTAEAARAVTAAMPFLDNAGEITVFTVEEAGSIDPHTPERLAQELRWHCPVVRAEMLRAGDRNGAEALQIAAQELRADLLVMGGYGHSRLGELIFGGFTRYILDDVQLPVLMTH